MKFSLKQIEVFLAVAQSENMTQAAEKLAMSQSAASESLKTLEQQFDIKLFDRAGKRLQLNELGKLIRGQAAAFIEHAQRLEGALARHQEVGALKVGATLSIGNYLAINILSQYRHRYPDARISLDVENTTHIASKIAHFELDIGLIEGEIAHPDLEITPWREDELVVFCSPEHAYANYHTLEDQHLLSAEWVLRESGSGTRQAFDHAMHGLVPQLKIALELQHTEAIKRAVEGNMGLGCLSRITLEDAFKRGNLVPLAVPHRDFHRQFYFILHRNKYRSAGIQNWLQLCREYQ
ncbi:MAG: LysR family transcriptional regulator [Oleiphilaceae bacterium]|nr:LysR family transcriptional regulator [Oleiphilaceae bacterium]